MYIIYELNFKAVGLLARKVWCVPEQGCPIQYLHTPEQPTPTVQVPNNVLVGLELGIGCLCMAGE